MGERVEWADLPKELLPTIGKSLDTRIDVLRFRSVCSSWRSSVPPFQSQSPCFPFNFSHPYLVSESASRRPYLCESTLYRLQLINRPSTSTSSSSSSASDKGWLVRVEESKSGKLRLLDPFSKYQFRYSPRTYPKTLNLLNFRVVELTKAYTLRCRRGSGSENESNCAFPSELSTVHGVNKVVMFPNSARSSVEGCAIFVIFHDGKLGYAKCGDKKLTLIDDQSFDYDDIIIYKGQFYVVDRLGIVSWIECSSLKLVQFSPPLCGLGSQKHLLESCGALYVVDRYLDKERRMGIENHYVRARDCPMTVGFKVYKLDEEWGQWVLAKSLGGRAFVLGSDCSFSVSAREFAGYKGNCIYFIDQHESRVFNLEDQSFDNLALSRMIPFWFPLTGLNYP